MLVFGSSQLLPVIIDSRTIVPSVPRTRGDYRLLLLVSTISSCIGRPAPSMAVPINAFASAHPLKLKFNALRSHVSIAESHVPQARPLNKPLIVASRHPLKTHQPISRRTALALLATLSVSPLNSMTQAASIDDFPYDSNKSRRYVDVGRPPPDRNAPAMKRDRPIFSIDDQLRAQDVTVGKGDPVKPGTLVIARWVAILDDGTTVDDANENLPAIFRPGAHQVPPGVEDAIVGMRSGGVRRIVGSSERILSNVRVGYDIGERSLVPNGSTVYIDLMLDRIDPFRS